MNVEHAMSFSADDTELPLENQPHMLVPLVTRLQLRPVASLRGNAAKARKSGNTAFNFALNAQHVVPRPSRGQPFERTRQPALNCLKMVPVARK